MSKDITFKRIVKANDLSYNELVQDIEEEKLYLNRLYQQGKNEHVQLRCNLDHFNDEIEVTQNIIKNKERLLRTLENKNNLKRGFNK